MDGLEAIAAYVANSNECITISLVRPGAVEPVVEEPFSPQFTYPIFGDDEVIFGYSALALDLTFRANDMRPSLKITYEDEKDFGEQKRMDIKGLLADYLPDYAYEEFPDDDSSSDNWRPPGSLIHSYTLQGRKFEIWVSTLADPKAKELFRRFQILIPLYIEGGTLQSLDDPDWTMQRWKLFLVYEVSPTKANTASPYTFVGFSTSYRLWVFPSYDIVKATSVVSIPSNGNGDSAAEDASSNMWRPPTPPWDSENYNYKDSDFDAMSSPSRERISQFVILPPFQGQAHGTNLYSTMAHTFLSDLNVFEITVEDPNEAFDDLRDWCDLLRLRESPEFAGLSLPSTIPGKHFDKAAYIPIDLFVDQNLLTNLRYSSRISPRQFSRLTEMQLLSTIPVANRSRARISRKNNCTNENDRRYFYWRLLVKERIYQKNIDQLAQLEVEERREKVDQACDAVQEEYNTLLKGVEKRQKWGTVKIGGSVHGKNTRGSKRRKVIDEDEDEDEDEDDSEQFAGKRPKVSS